uniref:BRCA1-associated RING domain protein 1-like n=1 Tax=Osmia lignaria TaxID=473952 RepID=UPI0014789ADF|nr:BRCA1-associated RING domain protein 1-like [Osmia lignaria]XP_034179267.1 BRCA1-associated RING domain protein 1-like [Osmia lignaria]XP_034179268.1 BRCA1-associated RING domain protein 1-like [Osmia lignaria]
MDTSWRNTREALKNFASILTCNKCGSKPIDAVRYTNCGHFFCNQCTVNHSVCIRCNIPVQPVETCNDHLIKNLVSYCSTIAEIIQEKDLWNTTTDVNTSQILSVPQSVPKASSVNYRIPKKNINKKNDKGETKLHIACIKKQEDYVKALLTAGANPNTKDHTGWTPLQEVVNFGYTSICKLLLECGALPNTPGAENRRALHDAAMTNRLPEAQLLLKYSASKHVYDIHGKKPIDYCIPQSEMWNILKDENDETNEEVTFFNSTLNQSFSATQPFNRIVIYASNLKDEDKKYLEEMASKHRIKIASVFGSTVTHVIVEANSKNIVQLSYNVMMALLRGCWLLNTEWIQLGMDIDEILKGDLEVFEVSGVPDKGIPKQARESAQNQNPGLFSQCYFYFALQSNKEYVINDMLLTKDALIKLVQAGGGTVLKREPDPEIIKEKEQLIPFHIANEPTHSLYKCSHYIIYAVQRDEQRIKYNMPHIKALPLVWLIECIEKFTLVDPLQLGLLRFT